MSDLDDEQIGRLLGRREIFRLAGLAGAAALAACTRGVPEATSASASPVSTAATTSGTGALPACVAKPALTEGPYFVDEKLNRSDIRSDPSSGKASPGVPLALAFAVSKIDGDGCTPLEGAMVDVWQCDASGAYSDEAANNTAGQKFLRGFQVTDADGRCAFTTIYPGFYQGRAVHIHFKIRTDDGYDFTSQLFFDDALSDEVFKSAPYSSQGSRDLRNDSDGIFQQAQGNLTLDTKKEGNGYEATFSVGLDMS